MIAAKDVKLNVVDELTEVVRRRVEGEMVNIFHLISQITRSHRFHIIILFVSCNIGINAIARNKAAFVSQGLVRNAVFLVRATVGKLLHGGKINYKI